MAKGYGPDTTLLNISAKMYESQSDFIDYSEVLVPLIDEYTKQVKANEAAVKKAILELPQIDFSKVDVQLQDKLKSAAIAMKRMYANAANKVQSVSYKDPNFDVYTQQMNAAQNGLTLINEDLEAFLLLRENGKEGILNNLDISEWNSPVSRDALTNLLSGNDDYLKNNIEFDEKGAWFIDPTRKDDDPKKRIRLSEMAHNKFVTGEGDASFGELQSNLITNAQGGGSWGLLGPLVGQGVRQTLRALGNEGIGMAAFDSDFFGGEKFIDKWMRNNGITNPKAIYDEKERLRNGDLGTVKGNDGKTFRKAFEEYIMQYYKSVHSRSYQSKTKAPTAYNVIAKKDIPVKDQVAHLKKINDKLEGQIIYSVDGSDSYFTWDPDNSPKKNKKKNENYKWTQSDGTVQWKSLEFVKNREISNDAIRAFTGNDVNALIKALQE